MTYKDFRIPIVGFEHLHLHTDQGSLLDGFGMCEEYGKRAKEINQQFLCVTDHGMMASIPRQIRTCEENKIKPLYGIELYYQPNHPDSKEEFEVMTPEEKKKIRKSYHLLAIAYNEIGYKNLIKMSSWAWANGFYYKPRINKSTLMKHKEGIIFTSCCYNGEIGQAFDQGGEESGFAMLEKHLEMFGKDNFYLEMMLLDFVKQKPYDKFLVKCHEKYNLKIIISQDCHYCLKEDSEYQRYMLMIQKNTTIADIEKKLDNDDKAEIFELQDRNLWMKSEEELNEKWISDYQDAIPFELFQMAKQTTVEVCHRCKDIPIDRKPKLPEIKDSHEKLKEELMKGVKERGIKGPKYLKRIQEEFELIKRKDFSSYFLIQKKIIDEARRITPIMLGWGGPEDAVGPGRGSGCGSLCLYTLGITDVDPIRHDLLFSRFLSENRGGKSIKLRFSTPPLEQ